MARIPDPVEVKVEVSLVPSWHLPERRAPNPPTRVENLVIWPGGYSRYLTRGERLLLWLRWPLQLAPPTPEQQELHRAHAAALLDEFLYGRGGR